MTGRGAAAYLPPMRLLFLALLALGCAADPVLLPDASPADAGPCSGACGSGTACQSGACVAIDAGGEDRPAPVDLGTPDAGSPIDVSEDRPAVDVAPDTYGACLANGIRTCDGRNVMVQIGERDGGLVHHCGACGHSCAAGEVCDLCRCGR